MAARRQASQPAGLLSLRYGLQENVGLFNRLLVDTGVFETTRAFAIWIMQAFFALVPKEVDEAAL